MLCTNPQDELELLRAHLSPARFLDAVRSDRYIFLFNNRDRPLCLCIRLFVYTWPRLAPLPLYQVQRHYCEPRSAETDLSPEDLRALRRGLLDVAATMVRFLPGARCPSACWQHHCSISTEPLSELPRLRCVQVRAAAMGFSQPLAGSQTGISGRAALWEKRVSSGVSKVFVPQDATGCALPQAQRCLLIS